MQDKADTEDCLASDLIIGARRIAALWGPPVTDRTVYYMWEQKKGMPGCFLVGSRLATRLSTVLAAIWAAECETFTPRQKQLVELNLKLRELLEAFDRAPATADIKKLTASAQTALEAALTTEMVPNKNGLFVPFRYRLDALSQVHPDIPPMEGGS